MSSSRPSRTVPLIVAVALLMENLDASVLSTALPDIAADFGSDPIHLKLVLTTYLLALAVFIPASGWVADKVGAKIVFRWAIVVFAAGSVACGLSQSLIELILARLLQGIGGAMMVPVGRLILLRAVPREGLVEALAWLTVPALIGPVLGPPLGGYITTYWDWRWIFWINIPLAVLGIALVTWLIPNIREDKVRPFDAVGFLLIGPGLAAFLTGVTLAGLSLATPVQVSVITGTGLVLIVAYIFHAGRTTNPIIDLSLLRLPSFRIAVTGGLLFRIAVGSLPFLLPLMLQLGFGMTAFQSGSLTFVSGAGAMAMKFAAQPLLRRFGFRGVLTGNALIAAVFLAGPGAFTPATPIALMIAVLFVGGLSRSLQFTALNAIAYAEVSPERLSHATSFSAVLQQLSGSLGITLAAMTLELTGALRGTSSTDLGNFPAVFGLVTVLTMISALVFLRLSRLAGYDLVRR
ncbi:MAG: DHA2 family efflux MFS transporter permease subunit [Candidatus Saccharibacteria bacterium]|nr:DHA2 family efflux MFS transporter permease subunit [Pseudorhodobacter sp.]